MVVSTVNKNSHLKTNEINGNRVVILLFTLYRVKAYRVFMKKDLNNIEEYEYKMYEVCHIKGCFNAASWHIDKVFWLCDECFNELDKGKLEIKK